MTAVVFIYDNILKRLDRDDIRNFTIGSGPKDNIIIRELLPAQISGRFGDGVLLVCDKKAGRGEEYCLKPGVLQNIDKEGRMKLLWSGDHNDDIHIVPFQPVDGGLLRFGRANDCDIVVTQDYVSRYHFCIEVIGDQVFVVDGLNGIPSTNGTFLNDRLLIGRAKLPPRSCIDILDIHISLGEGHLSVENAGRGVSFAV